MITQAQRDDIIARYALLMEWLGKRTSYHPEELPEHIRPPSNDERNQVELFDWHSVKPDVYFCYPSQDLQRATTWVGGVLGSMSVGKKWRSNIGDERQSVHVCGTNGKMYAGTLYGTYIRMRSVKECR